jgi:hypothetical protein
VATPRADLLRFADPRLDTATRETLEAGGESRLIHTIQSAGARRSLRAPARPGLTETVLNQL